MHATAHSKIRRSTNANITTVIVILKLKLPWLPNKVNKRCPAIIFAAKRTAKVPGRITDLTDSISTITGISTLGVPTGTKWAIMWLNCMTKDHTKDPSQRGKARDRVNTKWLEAVNTYGNNPIKLEKRM